MKIEVSSSEVVAGGGWSAGRVLPHQVVLSAEEDSEAEALSNQRKFRDDIEQGYVALIQNRAGSSY